MHGTLECSPTVLVRCGVSATRLLRRPTVSNRGVVHNSQFAGTQKQDALYTALERLEAKGLVTSRMGDPTPQRGGRAKRYVTVIAAGRQALTRAVQAYERLLDGLKMVGGAHA